MLLNASSFQSLAYNTVTCPCVISELESCTVIGTTVIPQFYRGNGDNAIYFTTVVTATGTKITVILW